MCVKVFLSRVCMAVYFHNLTFLFRNFRIPKTTSLWLVVFLVLAQLNVQAQKKNAVERLLDWGYNILEGDSTKPRKSFLIMLPIWGVSPETGWQLGLSSGYMFKLKQDSLTRPSILRLNWQYTQLGQFSIRPFVDVFLKQNTWHVKGQFVYNNFNEYYWGIGNEVPNTNKQLYYFKQQRVNLSVRKRIWPAVYAGVQVNYERMYNFRFPENSPLPSSTDEGMNGFECGGTGLSLVYDNRNKIFFTNKGYYLEGYYLFNLPFMGDGYTHRQSFLDARYFIDLKKSNVLAFQLINQTTTGVVPFRQLSVIGNDMYMRGYYNGRYRDRNMWVVQAELRKTIWGPLGAVAFAGAGNVCKSLNDAFTSIKPNYGFGIRGVLLRKEHLNARIDMGFGEKGNKGLYLTIGEAF